MLTFLRVDDDAALRSKVDEAMSVYDEYMKAKGEGDTEGPKLSDAKEGNADDSTS